MSADPEVPPLVRIHSVTVAERVPSAVHLDATNDRYLATKAGRGAHTLDLPCDDVLDAEA